MKLSSFQLVLEATWYCPRRCPHCYLGERRELERCVTTSELRYVLRKICSAIEFENGSAVVSGGEPSLLGARRLLEYIHVLREFGFSTIALETRELPPPQVLPHLSHVVISVDEVPSLTYVRKLAEDIVRRGTSVVLRTTVRRNSTDLVRSVVELARELGCGVALAPYIGTDEKQRPDPETTERVLSLAEEYSEYVDVYVVSRCVVGRSLTVDPYLVARLCPFIMRSEFSLPLTTAEPEEIEEFLERGSREKFLCKKLGLV